MLRDDFNRGIAALKQFGLVYDILIFERHLPQTIQFVDRHPDQFFVVDHLAKPRVKAGETSPWAERIRELSRRPNVYCKISGLATEADYQNWTEGQLRPYLDVVLDAFGPERLMFGSDWPVCLVAVSYAEWVSIIERFVESLSQSERERIWSGTAIEAYRL
jgi:L-fuconolactonase